MQLTVFNYDGERRRRGEERINMVEKKKSILAARTVRNSSIQRGLFPFPYSGYFLLKALFIFFLFVLFLSLMVVMVIIIIF